MLRTVEVGQVGASGGGAVPGTVFTAPATRGYLAPGGAPAVASAGHAWGAVLTLERTGLLAISTDTEPADHPGTLAARAGLRNDSPGRCAGAYWERDSCRLRALVGALSQRATAGPIIQI